MWNIHIENAPLSRSNSPFYTRNLKSDADHTFDYNASMNFHEQLREIEERYGFEENEYARELGRVVAPLQD